MKYGLGLCKLSCLLALPSVRLQGRTAQTALPFFDGLNAMRMKEELACTGKLGVDAHES
jgi:hypothetical protein